MDELMQIENKKGLVWNKKKEKKNQNQRTWNSYFC